jgi:hypothetical protein
MHWPKIMMMTIFTLLISCAQKNEAAATNTTTLEKNRLRVPASWQKGLINIACGPDDGLINQIRFGWYIDVNSNSLRANYPFLMIDYREAPDKTLQIFNATYCSAAEQCEYSNTETQTLSIRSADNSNQITGGYSIRLTSGKLITGKFTAEKNLAFDDSSNTAMQCG